MIRRVHHVKAISMMLRPSQVLQVADNCVEFVIAKVWIPFRDLVFTLLSSTNQISLS
jgi:hypothetical protein